MSKIINHDRKRKNEFNSSYWKSTNMVIEYISCENKICTLHRAIHMDKCNLFLHNYLKYDKNDNDSVKYQKFQDYIQETIKENTTREYIYINNEWVNKLYKKIYKKKIQTEMNKLIRIYIDNTCNII